MAEAGVSARPARSISGCLRRSNGTGHGEVTIVDPSYLLGCSGSYADQHAVLGQLGKHAED